MVFTRSFMDSSCCNGFCVAHSDGEEACRRRKFVTSESHSKGSERSLIRSSQDKLNREVDEIKLQLEMMRGML